MKRELTGTEGAFTWLRIHTEDDATVNVRAFTIRAM
jgi:hypothetical protein